jgi:dTDP-glucose pyrophosphorylase
MPLGVGSRAVLSRAAVADVAVELGDETGDGDAFTDLSAGWTEAQPATATMLRHIAEMAFGMNSALRSSGIRKTLEETPSDQPSNSAIRGIQCFP